MLKALVVPKGYQGEGDDEQWLIKTQMVVLDPRIKYTLGGTVRVKLCHYHFPARIVGLGWENNMMVLNVEHLGVKGA